MKTRGVVVEKEVNVSYWTVVIAGDPAWVYFVDVGGEKFDQRLPHAVQIWIPIPDVLEYRPVGVSDHDFVYMVIWVEWVVMISLTAVLTICVFDDELLEIHHCHPLPLLPVK